MSKAVLISIRPEWVQKIGEGKKTTEVRKTRPKLIPPFKCYIYCTLPRKNKSHVMCLSICDDDGETIEMNGKVVGEFTCNKVTNLFSNSQFWLNEDDVLQTCLSAAEIRKYANGANGLYGWHISNLKIYDAPKKLGEFWRDCLEYSELSTNCWSCENVCGDGDETDCNTDGRLYLRRPPQSWCYVEELE